MTRPDPLREIAEKIANQITPHARMLDIGRSDFFQLIVVLTVSALRTAHRQGQESMRERCANVCENPKGLVSRDYMRYAESTVAPEIRALEPETEGGV